MAALAFRQVLDRMLTACGLKHLVRIPTGACLFGCILVAELFPRAVGRPVMIRGGDGASDGAYRDEQGRCHGHYWCELHTAEGESWIVDITADQFDTRVDGARVWRATDPQSIAHYLPGDRSIVDAHVADFLRSLPSGISRITDR